MTLFDNTEYLSEGGWPNEVGPKASRSNTGVVFDKDRRRIADRSVRPQTQESNDAEAGDGCDWDVATQADANCNRLFFRSLVKIAFTVPKGMVVCFAILLAPNASSRFSARTWRIVTSESGGLPSLMPFDRAILSPARVLSDILAASCLASVANIETITSLNGPVESSHCSR
jgi:hypothetical protein